MKNKALNMFYEKMLEDVGLVDGGEGKLSYIRGDKDDKIAVTIDGKRLTLPTRENLKDADPSTIMFHPASEQLMAGPSPVLDALREYIMMRVSTTAGVIGASAISIAQDVALQKKVRGKGNILLKDLAAADEKMEQAYSKVIGNIGLSPDNRMYNIFLVASGSKDKPRALRTSKVSFPIMDDAFSEDMTEFFGVKMPRKTRDKPAITALLSNILQIDSPENIVHEYSSELRQAPYFHSLLMSFMDIAKHQNSLIDGLSKAIPDLKDIKYNLDWDEELDDFENFVKKVGVSVPLLPGNKGKSVDVDEEEDVVEEEKITSSSWKDLRDSIKEEDVREERRKPTYESSKDTSGWRSRFSSDNRDNGRSGISFGRETRNRRGGFDLGRREERYDERDYDRRRSYRGSYEPKGWRDIAGY